MVKVESAPPKKSKSVGTASILAERGEGVPSLVGCIQAQNAGQVGLSLSAMKIQALQSWEHFGMGLLIFRGCILKQNFAHIETIPEINNEPVFVGFYLSSEGGILTLSYHRLESMVSWEAP